ncbi:centromere protein T isoform X2 [Channa argus]|uniref:centromere protein T isoform X2 n=1 Tax=Channa argus TaxID=215402 RepID=UPI00351FDAB4
MDTTEDLSARVLLRHILNTEPPRTPITRSVSKAQSARRSRRSNKDAGAPNPQEIVRLSMKQKMRESITRKSLPATARNMTNTAASLLFDEGDTPRHILRNILQTDPVKSPVIHEKDASVEPQLPSASSSFTQEHLRTELSGLDLPDLTIGNAASIAKGLKRKRPRQSLNVTAFERRLKDGYENNKSSDNFSSLSLSSSTSLTLKTPFVDVQTEKRGLQRRISNRRKITEEEFGAAVNRRKMEGMSSIAPVQQGPGETADSEGFTLGLSKLSEPDITADIVNCNTALYAQSDAVASSFSIVSTQDKPTVLASQLQRQVEQEEKSKMQKEKSIYVFPTEEGFVAEPQTEECFYQLDESTYASQRDGVNSTAVGQPEETANRSKSEEGVAKSQTSTRHEPPESEEEKTRVEAQKEEEPLQTGLTMSQSEEKKDTEASSSKKENVVDSQTEQDDGVDSQPEDVSPMSQSDSEEGEIVQNFQTQGGDPVDFHEDIEASSQSEKDGNVESQTEDEQEEEDVHKGSGWLEHNLEHISQRAHHSEGGLIMPVTEAGGDHADSTEAGLCDGKSEAHSTIDQHSAPETRNCDGSQLHYGTPGIAEPSAEQQEDASYTAPTPDAERENSINPQDIMCSPHLSDSSPDEAPAQDAAEQNDVEEEEDEEESEEFPCKTPAFVREKINFLHTGPVVSSSVLKNIQASSYATSGTSEGSPVAKPKQVRQRKRGPAKNNPGLPKSYLMAVFKHFAKTKVSADVYPVLKEIMDKFFERLAEDLETYAHHAKRSTIEIEDTVLLLKRQGYVNDKVPVEVLIEKYLRMDQRKLLIPIATSGNVVIPKKRR